MSFIDNLIGIASNSPLARLAPANGDALRESITKLSKNSQSARLYKDANSKGRMWTETDFGERFDESASRLKALEPENKKFQKRANETSTRGKISTNVREAIGAEEGSPRSGEKLTNEQLKAFREKNSSSLKEHNQGIREAKRELKGHAKDYFFSGDLGTNAMRWGAVGAAYGAANVGLRTVSGGSATTNNQGQRDIAGIPFI